LTSFSASMACYDQGTFRQLASQSVAGLFIMRGMLYVSLFAEVYGRETLSEHKKKSQIELNEFDALLTSGARIADSTCSREPTYNRIYLRCAMQCEM